MTLSTGTSLGPCKIAVLLGAGGMAEGSRAHESRPGRGGVSEVCPVPDRPPGCGVRDKIIRAELV